MLAEIVGQFTLLAVVAVATFVMSDEGFGYVVAAFSYCVLALTAHHFWHLKDAPVTPLQWLLLLCGIPIAGGVLFFFEALIGQLLNPAMGFVEGALHTGAFGGALTAIATVGMSAVSLAGLARSFFVVTVTSQTDGDNSQNV
ncbi:MAG: hypothetical protein ABI583_10605 [Betaproteobacteria bacterium]